MEKFKKITREELKKWIDDKKDFVLIDVLAEGSYEVRHLPNAKNASVQETDFLEKVKNLVPDKNTTVVVYCASFTCQLSPRAASRLADLGYTSVYDFKGGLADWQEAKYPFEEVVEEKDEAKGCC